MHNPPGFSPAQCLFGVDLSLTDPKDVRADDLGAWRCTGSRALTVAVSSSLSSSRETVQIRRQYQVHGTDTDLHRMTAFVEAVDGKYVT